MDRGRVLFGEVDDCTDLTILFSDDLYGERVGLGEGPDSLLFEVLFHFCELLS